MTSAPTIETLQRDVVVIGGGDTGSDCIGTSVRQGALSVEQLEAAVGFPILHDLFTDAPFGHEDFSPCFEILEEHRNEQRNAESSTDGSTCIYEMVFIRNDDGFATTVFVPATEDIPGNLLAMCRSFATVTCG